MQFNVYDNNTGEPIKEEVFAISEGGTLYRLDVVKGGYISAEPVAQCGGYTLQFFHEEADSNGVWHCQKEVY